MLLFPLSLTSVESPSVRSMLMRCFALFIMLFMYSPKDCWHFLVSGGVVCLC